jgi:hypothetical protein
MAHNEHVLGQSRIDEIDIAGAVYNPISGKGTLEGSLIIGDGIVTRDDTG